MGLDFSLYKKRKDQSVDDFFNSENLDELELAYGRKSWELVYKLADSKDIDNCYGLLKHKNWQDLMRQFADIGDKLDDIWEAYGHYEYYLEHLDDDDRNVIDRSNIIFTQLDRILIAQYEYWYQKTFGTTPTLGYYFSVGYMKSFYEAKDLVRDVLTDPDYDVLMSISY